MSTFPSTEYALPETATISSLLFLTLIFFLILAILIVAIRSIELESCAAREARLVDMKTSTFELGNDLEKAQVGPLREAWWKNSNEKGRKESIDLLLRIAPSSQASEWYALKRLLN